MKEMDEWNLSDKRRMEDDHSLLLRNEVVEHTGYCSTEEDFDEKYDDSLFISVKDVREFIRRLIADEYINSSGEAIKRIRELAGEKLV